MKKITLLLTSALFAAPAFAEGNFFGADIGSTMGYPDSTNLLTQAFIDAGASSARAEQKAGSLGAGLFLGRWFDANLGWEFGYKYLGGGVDGSWTTVPSVPGTYDYSASALHWAFLARTQAGSGNIYGKVGIYRASTESQYTITGSTPTIGKDSNMGLVLGAGYESPFSENLSGRFGVDIYNGVEFQEITYGTPASQNLYLISLGLAYYY